LGLRRQPLQRPMRLDHRKRIAFAIGEKLGSKVGNFVGPREGARCDLEKRASRSKPIGDSIEVITAEASDTEPDRRT
jgi:hypothetical protein